MLSKFIINLVEALIVSYSLSRLCHVKKQKLYFVLNTLMTFSIEIISDYFDANYAPLAIAYIICWNILLLFFTRKEYIYNLFMCIFNELLIALSALLPLMFISHYYLLLAAVEAKIYHLLLSVLFIRYQKRYRYFINKYWVLVMMNLTACLLILNLQGRIIMEGSYTFKTIMTIFLCIFVVFLSLTFFAFLEESNNEKEKVTMFCTNPSAGRCVVPDIGGLRCEAVFRHACIGYRLRGKRRPAGKGHECQACR